MRSLQTKIISLTICCTLLTMSISLIVSYWGAKNILHNDSDQIITLLCDKTAQELNDALQNTEQSASTIHNFAIEYLRGKDLSLFTNEEELTAYIEEVREIALRIAEHTPGALAFYYHLSPDLHAPSDGFFMKRPDWWQEFPSTPFTDVDISASENEMYIPQNNDPTAASFSAWLNPYYKKSLDTWILSYIVPVVSDNTVIGVVGIDISSTILQKIAGSVSIYDTGYAVLLDNNDNIVYHPDYPFGLQQAGYLGELKVVMALLINSIQDSKVDRYTWKGEEYMVSSSFLDNGMPFAIVVPTNEITIPLQALMGHLSGSSSLLILLLLPFLFYWLIRHIITPLKQLTIASQKIADGDLDVKIDYVSNDEIGLLAENFRQTACALKERIDYINHLTYTDTLTKIHNSTAYNEAVLNLDTQINVGDVSFAIVIMDLNDLKKMNDTFGHGAGDVLLQDAAQIMKKTFGSEYLYRIGGDEFVAILTDDAIERREELLERFKEEIDRFNRSPGKHYEQDLRIARGMALYDSSQDSSFADVFQRADDLMYQNKQELKS